MGKAESDLYGNRNLPMKKVNLQILHRKRSRRTVGREVVTQNCRTNMKKLLSILRMEFLVNDYAFKNWRVILFYRFIANHDCQWS